MRLNMSIVDNYRRLKEEIVNTAIKCRRNPEEIQLIVVTKNQSWETVLPIYHEGCREFGESRLQEALPKINLSPRDCHWHFIGSLQKNKVRKVLDHFEIIHSVDSLELAHKISEVSQEKNKKTSIFLQVNTSGESSKHGMSPTECLKHFEELNALVGLDIQGLMTIAPFIDEEVVVYQSFENLRLLRDKLVTEYHPRNRLPHLSMGMSHDFKIAIAEGATMLRIGTKIWQ